MNNIEQTIAEREKLLGTESKEKIDQLSEELEKEVYEHLWKGRIGGDLSKPIYLSFDELIAVARHFAEWERKQIEDEWLEDRNGCFNDGVEEGKRLMEIEMMKDAMPCEIDWHDGPFPNIKEEQLYSYIVKHGIVVGDKVKLIIIKED